VIVVAADLALRHGSPRSWWLDDAYKERARCCSS
jgi:hypothetical protein